MVVVSDARALVAASTVQGDPFKKFIQKYLRVDIIFMIENILHKTSRDYDDRSF